MKTDRPFAAAPSRRRLPVLSLIVIGLYIGFLAYILLVDDQLGNTPISTAENPVLETEIPAESEKIGTNSRTSA